MLKAELVFRISNLTQRFKPNTPLVLESGEPIHSVEIAYRTWGKLSATGDNAIIICHALTGSADADNWWADLLGPDKALDTNRYFIVCSNTLGGCYGSTGPTSLTANGKRWGSRFPKISIRDQVQAQFLIINHLNIRRVRTVIGGSLGGLQALEWGWMDSNRVESVITIAASGRHTAWCLAWNEAQRMAIHADEKFRDGEYPDDDPPQKGLAAARAMAMVSYRSAHSLNDRFGRNEILNDHKSSEYESKDFAVRNWLRFHGRTLNDRFDANTYLTLLDSMDTHDISRGRGDYFEILKAKKLPILVGSIDTDVLYIEDDQIELFKYLPSAELVEIDSLSGHDGFLIDAKSFAYKISEFLNNL